MTVGPTNSSTRPLVAPETPHLTAADLAALAEPQSRTVTTHRANQPIESFSPGDTLRLPFVPGFEMLVEDAFRE